MGLGDDLWLFKYLLLAGLRFNNENLKILFEKWINMEME